MQNEETCCERILKSKDSIPNEDDTFPLTQLKAIDDIIKTEGYIKYEVSKRRFSTNGGNYLADLYEINIKGGTADGNKETNVFVKATIPEDRNNVISITYAFYKEVLIYNELSKKFIKLQNEANVPIDEKFNIADSCDATNIEALYLDNLTKKGYTTLYRMDTMSLEFGELAMQQLAKFHGIFYVLQKKQPKYFDNNLKILKQGYSFNEDWKEFIRNISNISTQCLNGEMKEKVDKFIMIMLEKFPLYSGDTTMPGCTICHGDYRMNNILVKETNGKVTKVVPVDYQLLHYGCPINDLVYLIFNSSDQEFRKNHLTYLKDVYYEHLEKFLSYFNLDVNEIYSRKDFERQFKERLDLGLMYALYCVPFHFAMEGHLPNLGTDDFTKLEFVLDDRYRDRVQGIVDDFIQWGYL